jgi:hypothetical protein
LQLVLHAVPAALHAKGAHGATCWLHLPPPSQVPIGVTVPPAQLAAPHDAEAVGY